MTTLPQKCSYVLENGMLLEIDNNIMHVNFQGRYYAGLSIEIVPDTTSFSKLNVISISPNSKFTLSDFHKLFDHLIILEVHPQKVVFSWNGNNPITGKRIY